jgi:hypothetical protein
MRPEQLSGHNAQRMAMTQLSTGRPRGMSRCETGGPQSCTSTALCCTIPAPHSHHYAAYNSIAVKCCCNLQHTFNLCALTLAVILHLLLQPCAGETRRTTSLTGTLHLMQQLLFETLPAGGGWSPGQVHLLGFSQGGCVALELARACKGGRQLGG